LRGAFVPIRKRRIIVAYYLEPEKLPRMSWPHSEIERGRAFVVYDVRRYNSVRVATTNYAKRHCQKWSCCMLATGELEVRRLK